MASRHMTRLVDALMDDWRGTRQGDIDATVIALLAAITDLETSRERAEQHIEQIDPDWFDRHLPSLANGTVEPVLVQHRIALPDRGVEAAAQVWYERTTTNCAAEWDDLVAWNRPANDPESAAAYCTIARAALTAAIAAMGEAVTS